MSRAIMSKTERAVNGIMLDAARLVLSTCFLQSDIAFSVRIDKGSCLRVVGH